MNQYIKFVGMDVHKDTIAVAIAKAGTREAIFYGEIENTPESVEKLAKKMSASGERVLFCYEAGPCGYEVYWQLQEKGYDCLVVAPSLIPKKAGDRVKTDRRDSITLARLLRPPPDPNRVLVAGRVPGLSPLWSCFPASGYGTHEL